MKKAYCLFFIIINCYSTVYTQNYSISTEVLYDFISSIPAPIELIYFTKKYDIPSEENLLPSIATIQNVKSKVQQIIKLGICQTNFDYYNIYQENIKAIQILQEMQNLTQKLHLEKYAYPPKSPIFQHIVKNNFNQAIFVASYFREHFLEQCVYQGQADISILVITGSWLESLYLLSEINQKYPNSSIKEQIGYQKIILDHILLLLSFYEDDTEIKKLIDDLNELQIIFDNVKITYEYNECEIIVKNKLIFVNDKTISNIIIDSQTLQNINKIIRKIRENIIN